MKKSYLLLALTFVLALVGCDPEEKQPDPQIALTSGTATESTLSFTITPKDAKQCAYVWVANGTEVPSAADILAKGTAVDASKESVQTISGLTDNTEYIIVAAVSSGSVQKTSAPLKMKTLERAIEAPVVTLTAGTATANTITFTVASTNAEAVAYMVVTDETPEAAAILENGVAIEANTEVSVTLNELTPETAYTVIAAASNADATVVSEALTMTTSAQGTNDVTFVTLNGRRWAENNYGFQFELSDGNSMMLDMYCPTSVGNIVPEAEYPVEFYPAYEDLDAAIAEGRFFTHAEGSLVYGGAWTGDTYEYTAEIAGGKVTVEHLDAGYKLHFELETSDGDVYDLSYEGLVEGLFETEDFQNPPVPYTDDVIETSLTYVGGQFYEDPGYAFTLWMTSQEGPYNIWTNLIFPKATDGLMPEGTYTLFNGSLADLVGEDGTQNPEELVILGGDWSHISLGEDGSYIPFAEGTTITVKHLEGAYRLTLDIKNTLGLTLKATWEGAIEKHWSWDPDIVQPGGETPVEPTEAIAFGAASSWNRGNFEIFFRDAQGTDLIYLDAYSPATAAVWSVLPEGTYTIDPNATWEGSTDYEYYINANYSASYLGGGYTTLASGEMVVRHLEAGYEISVNGVDANGVSFAYTYSGIVEPANDWSTFNNPPIPYNDVTIETVIEAMQGAHAQARYYDLYATTEDGEYQIYLPLVAAEDPGTGLIPEGTYNFAAGDAANQVYAEAWLQEGEDSATKMTLSNAVVTVAHLDLGYKVDVFVETDLKTKVIASWSGLIFKTENASYPFKNPGYEYPAKVDLTFDTIEYLGDDNNGGREFKMTNTYGDVMTLCFNAAMVDENGQIEPGVYQSVYWYDGTEGFTFNGNDCAATLVDYPRSYPYYMDGGYIQVEKEGNNYSILYDGYTWMDSREIFRARYNGPIGEEGGEEGGEEDDTVYPFEATLSNATYEGQNCIYLEQQGTVNGKRVSLQFQMYDADDTIVEYYEANVFAPGVYTIGSDYTGMVIWAEYCQVSIDGGAMEMPESGTLTVTHVDGKYNLLYDFKTASATIKAQYTGSLAGMKDPSEMGGGEEAGIELVGDFVATYTSAYFEYPNCAYLEQQGSVNGEKVVTQLFLGDWANSAAEEGGFIPAGVYEVSSDYTGKTVWADYSQLNIGAGTEAPESGTVTVNHVNGQYQIIYDITTASGKLQATYEGDIRGMIVPEEGGEEGGEEEVYAEFVHKTGYTLFDSPTWGYLEHQGSVNGENVIIMIYLVNDARHQDNLLTEGVYSVGGEGMYIGVDWSQVQVGNGQMEQPASGSTVSVKHLSEGGYEIIYDIVGSSGSTIKAKYIGNNIVAM